MNKIKVIPSLAILILFIGCFIMTSCGNKANQSNNVKNTQTDKNQTTRGTTSTDKSYDMQLKDLLNETENKFIQLEFNDTETGKTMSYNLYIPDGYDKDKCTQYPLVLFIADSSTAGKDIKVPLTQGYGGVIWVSAADQAKHPSFVLVPQYTAQAVNDQFECSDEVEMTIRLLNNVVDKYNIDRNRLYTTGQSMGGMMAMYFNITHPDLFAASIFVSCQWDTSKMARLANDKFFYIVAAGDDKASKGMAALKTVLDNEGAKVSTAEWSAKLSIEEQNAKVESLLAKGNNINFITFTVGSVMPADGKGIEHMNSFDYAYKLDSVRDWLFKQKK